jgi:hypothetical protein
MSREADCPCQYDLPDERPSISLGERLTSHAIDYMSIIDEISITQSVSASISDAAPLKLLVPGLTQERGLLRQHCVRGWNGKIHGKGGVHGYVQNILSVSAPFMRIIPLPRDWWSGPGVIVSQHDRRAIFLMRGSLGRPALPLRLQGGERLSLFPSWFQVPPFLEGEFESRALFSLLLPGS